MQIRIPTLQTERLTLEPLAMSHSSGVFELWSDPEVCRYSGVVRDYAGEVINMPAASSNDSDRIIDFWIRAAEDGWGFRWAVLTNKDGGRFAGMIGFNSLTACAEIAYHLLPGQWGNGIMTEAAGAAVDWVKRNGSSELEAFIEPENRPSAALAERLGMTATGAFSEGAERFSATLDPRL